MRKFNAKQLHENPNKVYAAAHQGPVVIRHRSHGDMLLISPAQIFSRHTNIDGSVNIHLRSLELQMATQEEQETAA